MPDFWQFPTVSMGLGPLMAIYQARFMKYLQDRGLAQTEGRKVWAFMGDGEMDEPESMGAIGMASRENLDNLIFVVNCNLQRLDGPVRGNGKIIQELEGDFRGAGWNVIKVIWGTHWDALLARDKKGILMQRMMECVDGEYQTFKCEGRRVRARVFLQHARAEGAGRRLVRRRHLAPEPRRPRSAQGLRGVPRGREPQGPADRDPRQDHQGLRHGRRPARRRTSRTSRRRCRRESLRSFRDRFHIPVPDDKLDEVPYVNVRRRLAGARVHARAAHGARRLPAAAPAQGRRRSPCPSWRRSSAS